MKRAIIIASMLLFTGCASLVDGLLGRYHKYDSTEYRLTVDMVHRARTLEAQCPNIQVDVQDLRSRTAYFITYTEGRQYNKRTVELAQSLDSILKDTESRTKMSAFFCRERSKNIVKAAETLRASSGSKPK